jgi:hypothetical protein
MHVDEEAVRRPVDGEPRREEQGRCGCGLPESKMSQCWCGHLAYGPFYRGHEKEVVGMSWPDHDDHGDQPVCELLQVGWERIGRGAVG